MAVVTTKQIAFMRALYDALGDRVGLAGVHVSLCPIDPTKAPKADILQLHGAYMDQDYLTQPTTNQEVFYVEGSITVVRPGAGSTAGDAALQAAEDILSELEAEIYTTMQVGGDRLGGTTSYRLYSSRIEQAFSTRGHLAYIEFTIRVVAQLRRIA